MSIRYPEQRLIEMGYRVYDVLQEDGTWSFFKYNKKNELIREAHGLTQEEAAKLRGVK